MSIQITNEVVVQWHVADPVYPYAATMIIPLDKLNEFNVDTLRVQQEQEYAEWLADLKQREALNKQG